MYRGESKEAGFTVMELLVATAIGTLITGLLVGNVVTNQQAYHEDVVRTRINSNLRSALDIVAMNIRQAGENLSRSFPAVQVEDGLSDILILRRAILSEVLTVCESIGPGETSLDLSDNSSANPECLPGNAINVINRVESYRDGESIRIYLYNRVSREGEFLDFTRVESAGGEYRATVSAVQSAYANGSAALYVIEEFRFELNATADSLQLTVDGVSDQPRAVAFSVVGFDVAIQRNDGSVESELTLASSYDWKEISEIGVRLTGRETRKNRVFETSISAGFFPRNVLSE